MQHTPLVLVSTVLLAVSLAGCATPVVMLTNESTGQVARCGGGSAGAIAGGLIGYNIERSSDANCVRDYEAKGFRRTSQQTYAEPQKQLPARVETPPAVGTALGATPALAPGIKGESRYMFTAESVAKAKGCTPPSVAMTAKGAGSESFMVGCPNGTTLAIRCEVDGCRILQ